MAAARWGQRALPECSKNQTRSISFTREAGRGVLNAPTGLITAMEQKKILVVEDDSAIRRGLVDALEFSGYEVLQAGNGNDGMREALRATIDLLMLDLILPGHSGFEILQAAR